MVDALLNSAAIFFSAALTVPTAIFASECVAAIAARREHPKRTGKRPAVAVVVPAHNEESEISLTLSFIRPQMREVGDRLIVIADNCDDRTGALAREAGAEVIERWDPLHRGKGYALAAGISSLAGAPPPVVILLDADCHISVDAIDVLTREVLATGRPIQGCYLLMAPPEASLGQEIAAFAFLVKNRVRPLGLQALGLPCQLTGSGMAFPWKVICDAQLANSNLVEDMKLGLDLAQAGQAPRFCDDAQVTSRFPTSQKGTRTQRHRWEAGHLGMSRVALGALQETATYRNLAYFALLLDVIVPPLSLLGLALAASLLASAGLAVTGYSIVPLAIAALNFTMLLGATALAWVAFGRRVLPARAFLAMPAYMLKKLGLYHRVILGRDQEGWIRTDRSRGDGR